jgi:inorganic triphosphatase YgiF
VGAVKGLGGVQGAIHQREEMEIAIEPGAAPERWPESPARALALRLSRGQSLVERLAIHQVRHTRDLLAGERRAAELSLDEVRMEAGLENVETLELEVELKEAGSLDDLLALVGALTGFGLRPEPRSKFERGMALVPPP